MSHFVLFSNQILHIFFFFTLCYMKVLANSLCDKMGIKTRKYNSVIFQQDHEMLKASRSLFTYVSLKCATERTVHGMDESILNTPNFF